MGEVSPSRYVVQAGWDSVPHLDDKTKKELLDSTPPNTCAMRGRRASRRWARA